MSSRPRKSFALVLALQLAACGAPSQLPPDSSAAAGVDASAANEPDASAPGLDAGAWDASAAPGPDAATLADTGPRIVTVRLFHTSDEHGWLQPATEGGQVLGGAANVRACWARDGFDPAKDLALSSGDNWTGPAISSFFQGESTVAVLDLMGYAASAIGNHEFDWGRDVLKQRFAEASFPELAANIRVTATGKLADFARPYALVESQGARLGIIGLTTPETAVATNPKYVSDLTFDEPLATLEGVVPEVRGQGVDAIVVLAHEYHATMEAVADALDAKSRVEVILTGHDHGSQASTHNGIPVLGSGWAFRDYTVVTLSCDLGAHRCTVAGHALKAVAYPAGGKDPVAPDAAVAARVDGWQTKLDAALGETIGYTASGIALASWSEANWATDAWLAAFPEADVAVQNFGGLRQAVPAGPVTRATVFGVMPFDNRIVKIRITGAQLVADLADATRSCAERAPCYPAVAGMRFTGAGASLHARLAGGAAIDPAATYTVLTTDYLYAGGDGYLFGLDDPAPVDLGVSYRDPAIDWTAALHTTSQDPLEAHLDPAPRNQ